MPAFCAGFQDRGVLRSGAAADIVIYDYEKLDYEFPNFRHDLPGDEYRVASAGTGYRYVLVNGEVTIEDDKETQVHSGKLLRSGGGQTNREPADRTGCVRRDRIRPRYPGRRASVDPRPGRIDSLPFPEKGRAGCQSVTWVQRRRTGAEIVYQHGGGGPAGLYTKRHFGWV